MSHPYRVPHLKWFALSTVLNQEVIGRGSFGVVRKGVLRETDRVRPGIHSCAGARLPQELCDPTHTGGGSQALGGR